MTELLVVVSGERGTENIEAVCQTQEQVDQLLAERGAAKGRNKYFPDEYWDAEHRPWQVVPAPFITS